MRNVLARTPAKQRTAKLRPCSTRSSPGESKAEAQARWDTVADALRKKQDKLGAFMDFPREHWVRIGSTNSLECVNREIKPRADVIGVRRGVLPLEGPLLFLMTCFRVVRRS